MEPNTGGGGHWVSLQSIDYGAANAGLASTVTLDWMHCQNRDCGALAIRAHKTTPDFGADSESTTQTWYVHPRAPIRLLDPLVPEPFRTDYLEAAAILDLSPRMSAVLSRRILADILKQYAQLEQRTLPAQIDAFAADPTKPSSIRENLQHFREAGNFGAHTQIDKTSDAPQIIDVSRDDAEWTLDILDRLFDFLIVGPERDKQMRARWDKNIEAAGRHTIPPLPDAEEES